MVKGFVGGGERKDGDSFWFAFRICRIFGSEFNSFLVDCGEFQFSVLGCLECCLSGEGF